MNYATPIASGAGYGSLVLSRRGLVTSYRACQRLNYLMIHVPFSAVTGERTLGEILHDARWRYVRTTNLGIHSAMPIMAYEVLHRIDPELPLFTQISSTPEQVIFVGLERRFGRFVVEQALTAGRNLNPAQNPARVEMLDRRQPALLPSPAQPLRATFAAMQKSRSHVLAWLLPTGRKRVPHLGIALVAGTDAVAQVRRQMQLDGNKALNFLCPPVLADEL